MKKVTITFGRRKDEYLPKTKKNKQFDKRFQNEGFVLRSYDATYERTMFDFVERAHGGSRIIEVEDVNSGIRFIVIKKGTKK